MQSNDYLFDYFIAIDFPSNVKYKLSSKGKEEGAANSKPHAAGNEGGEGDGDGDGREDEKKKDKIELEECLKLFLQEEVLSEQESWYCPNCQAFTQATKKFDVWNFPSILIIHLKRFQQLPFSLSRSKIQTLVNFPIYDLDLSEFELARKDFGKHKEHHVDDHFDHPVPPQRSIYDLVAVSNHMGSLSGGHYTAFARNKINQQWYCFDDRACREIAESQIITPNAYVLFYLKRDFVLPPFPSTSQ